MYSEKTIVKYQNMAASRLRELLALSDEEFSALHVHVSIGNRKIGRTLNISLLPILTCPNCKECKFLCYDIKACLQYPANVLEARAINTAIAIRDSERFFNEVRAEIRKHRTIKFFRWHVAGDIRNMNYLENMIAIAREFDDRMFWTYTKNYAVVNLYCLNHGGKNGLPENLSIMFSEWRGMPMVNPYGFGEFRVVFRDEVKPQGFYCGGNCDVCKETNRGCVANETTYCNEH